MSPDTYALLDDASTGQVRLLHGLLAHLQCASAASLPALLQQMQEHLAAGRHAFLLMSYELGAQMHGVAAREDAQPYAQALIFTSSDALDQAALARWFANQTQADAVAGISAVHSSVTQTEFCAAIARIQEYIAAGDTYQVNFTYRLRFQAYGSPAALYQRLRARQPVPYGALVQLPDGTAILSLSPELFIRHTQGQMLARPMKGTAPASSDAEQNTARALALAQDVKNRAENLMIVDLLRNDLARIAEIGTVQVPQLFEVTQFGRVLQMTSSIQATLRKNCDLPEIMQALYPCGSITGAPKRRTMEIIREIESTPRGIYTGALGWFAPPTAGNSVGDFCLSVPIRTMQLQAPQENGLCAAEMGVGAGIVYDSESMDEYRECQLKANFLTSLEADLALFETMYATRLDGCRHQAAHLARLQASCAFFNIRCDGDALAQQLHAHCQQLLGDSPYRLKLSIAGDGTAAIQSAPLAALPAQNKLLISDAISPVPSFLLAHKSSVRQHYDAAWQQAEKVGAFDMLFCNEQGHITEGGRSNIFVKLAGQWYTPPLTDGVLPGVMRAQLIQQWQAQERSLTLDDLRIASDVQVCNALRGAFQVELVWPQQAV